MKAFAVQSSAMPGICSKEDRRWFCDMAMSHNAGSSSRVNDVEKKDQCFFCRFLEHEHLA